MSATSDTHRDPLLAEARVALAQGELPEDVRTRIAASDKPAHARARRILAAVDGHTPDALPSGGTEGAPPRVESEASGTSGSGDDATQAAPSLSLNTPPPGDDPEDPDGDDDRSDSSAAKSSSSSPAAGPKLSVITSLKLNKRGDDVELVIKAAAPVTVGTAAQLGSGRFRYVLPSSGALPGALQARPKLEGVSVVDVRRGENTVQLAVELAEGWRAAAPQRAASGAKIRFRGP